MSEQRLDVLRQEIIALGAIDTRKMPESWRRHLDYQIKSRQLDYMRARMDDTGT